MLDIAKSRKQDVRCCDRRNATIFRMIDAYSSVHTIKDAREIVETFSYILRLFYDFRYGDNNLFGTNLLLHSEHFFYGFPVSSISI